MEMKNKDGDLKSAVSARPDARKAIAGKKPEPDRLELDSELLSAVANGYLLSVKRLIEQGAKDSMNPYKMNAVKVAATNAQLEVLKFLVRAGFEPDVPDYDGRTALMAVCRFHDPEAVMLLLEHGADVNRVDRDGNTALTAAVGWKDAETVKVLLEAGADPDSVVRGSREIELMLREAMKKQG